jgi:WD40 repeat protein
MPIPVSCDNCGRDYRIADDRAGTRFRCKDCGEPVDVPDGMPRRSSGPKKKKSSGSGGSGAIVAVVIVGVIALIGGMGALGYMFFMRGGDDGGQQVALQNPDGGGFNPGGQGVVIPPNNGGGNSGGGNQNNGGNAGNNGGGNNGGGGRFDIGNIDTDNGGGGAGGGNRAATFNSSNPDSGKGFGALVGVVQKFTSASAGEDRAKAEFELLQEPPDLLPPRNWSYEADPLTTPFSYAGTKKDFKIEVPRSSGFGGPEDVTFPVVPSPFVCVGGSDSGDDREIWNLAEGKRVAEIEGGDARTTHHALSPDGKYFAAMDRERLGVWDVEAGMASVVIDVEHSDYLAIPRNDRMVTVNWGFDKTMEVYELPSGTKLHSIKIGHVTNAPPIAFSPGGNVFVSGRSDWPSPEEVALFSLETGEVLGVLPNVSYDLSWDLSPKGWAFSDDGTELAIVYDGWSQSKLVIFNLNTGTLADHYTFEKKLSEMAVTGGAPREAQPLVWMPGGKEILAYEHGLLNRDAGAIVWNVGKSELDWSGKRRPIGNSHLTVIDNQGRAASVYVYPLPEEQIQKGIAAVQQRPKPEATSTATLITRDGQVLYPNAGGPQITTSTVPWTVQPDAAAPGKLQTVALVGTRGEPREIGASAGASPRLIVVRGKEKVNFPRVPAGSTDPGQLASHRSFARKKDESDGGFDGGNVASSGAAGDRVWVDIYDFSTGKRSQELKLDFDGDLLSVSPDGSHFAMLDPAEGDRIDIFSTGGSKHVVGWFPYGRSANAHDRSTLLVSAVLADATHCITLSGEGHLCGWNLPAVEPYFSVHGASVPSLSPGGKYLGYCDGSSFNFVDVANGQLVGTIPDVGRVQGAAWHPNGNRLALLSEHNAGYYLFAVDVSNGQVSPPFPVPVISSFLQWCGDSYVLIDNSKLVDVDQKGVAWSYTLAQGDAIPLAQSTQFAFLESGGQRGRVQVRDMPGGPETGRLQGAKVTLDLVLKPGEKCAVEYRLSHPSHDQNFQQGVRQKVESQLAAHQITIDPSAPVKLIVTSSERPGEMINTTYTVFGSGYQEVSYQDKLATFRVHFETNGQTCWENQSGANKGGFFVTVQEGQTIEQALEENYQSSCKAAFSWLQLPPFVFSPQGANGAGTTALGGN